MHGQKFTNGRHAMSKADFVRSHRLQVKTMIDAGHAGAELFARKFTALHNAMCDKTACM